MCSVASFFAVYELVTATKKAFNCFGAECAVLNELFFR